MLGEKRAILDIVIQFFKEDDWKYERLEGKPFLKTAFKGENLTCRCFAQARDEAAQLLFYSVVDTLVPEDKRIAVAEFLTRANFGKSIGNFEMDFSDGEVRFKTSVDVEGGELTVTMARNLVLWNLATMDKYYPGLMSTIYGSVSPADAIAKIGG